MRPGTYQAQHLRSFPTHRPESIRTSSQQPRCPNCTQTSLAVPRRVLALKTSQDEYSRCIFKTSLQDVGPNSRQTIADVQDITTRLGAFALEPRRHKTLPYAASPDYVKLGQIYKTLQDVWGHLLWTQDVTRRFHTQPPRLCKVSSRGQLAAA